MANGIATYELPTPTDARLIGVRLRSMTTDERLERLERLLINVGIHEHGCQGAVTATTKQQTSPRTYAIVNTDVKTVDCTCWIAEHLDADGRLKPTDAES